MISHFASRRKRDWAIRVALGLPGTGVVTHIVRQGVTLAADWDRGLAQLGAPRSRACSRSFLFGVTALDPLSFAAAAALSARDRRRGGLPARVARRIGRPGARTARTVSQDERLHERIRIRPLGVLEEQILVAVVRTRGEAFGMEVRREIERVTGRDLAIGAVYATLDRLEAKGFVASTRVAGRGRFAPRCSSSVAQGRRDADGDSRDARAALERGRFTSTGLARARLSVTTTPPLSPWSGR